MTSASEFLTSIISILALWDSRIGPKDVLKTGSNTVVHYNIGKVTNSSLKLSQYVLTKDLLCTLDFPSG